MPLLKLLFVAISVAAVAAIAACSSAGAEDPSLPQVNNTPAAPGEPTAVPRYAVAAGYDGPLFDTHMHLDKDGFAERVTRVMQANGVGHAVVFAKVAPGELEDDLEELADALEPYPGMFVPFFHVDPRGPQDVEDAKLQSVVDGSDIEFKGFGEVGLYRPPWQGTRFDGPEFAGIYEFAVRNGLFVMMHPRDGQMGELKNVLRQHPDLKFLMHGVTRDLLEELPGMLAEFPNLYYTLDTSTLAMRQPVIDEFGVPLPSPSLMFTEREKAGLMEALPVEAQQIAEQQAAVWGPVIEAAPDRIMWGTDAAFDWHADSDAYGALIDLSRRFIELLPEDVRDAYAFGNAERLFGE